MLETIKGLRLHRESALGVLPGELHGYLDRRIEVETWYPEADAFGIARAAGQLFGPPGLDAWRWMGRQRATLDLLEIFSDCLHVGNPAATLEDYGRLWSLYRSSGRMQAEIGGGRPHRLHLIDYPILNAEMVRLISGYIEAGLELSGLSEPGVTEPQEWASERATWTVDWS